MKLPNGYGSIAKLSGKRRKPYAVRVSYLEEQPNGTVKRKQKYSEVPTFADMYQIWKKYRNSLKSKPGASTWRNYDIAFNRFSSLLEKKIINIRAQELQDCITANSSKSKTTIGSMRAIIRGMWSYAVVQEYTENDITQHLVFEYTSSDTPIHTRFTDAEIKLLWDSLWVINNVDILLIYIYTGCRPVELLEIKASDVHLDERYMVGCVKTEAGKNNT